GISGVPASGVAGVVVMVSSGGGPPPSCEGWEAYADRSVGDGSVRGCGCVPFEELLTVLAGLFGHVPAEDGDGTPLVVEVSRDEPALFRVAFDDVHGCGGCGQPVHLDLDAELVGP